MAEKAAAAEPEALEPRAEGKAWHGLNMPLPLSQEDSGEPKSPLQEALTKGMRRRGLEGPLSLPVLRDSPSEDVGHSGHHKKHREWACWLCKRAHRPS